MSVNRWPGRRWRNAWRLLRAGDLRALTRRAVSFLGRLNDRAPVVDYADWRRRWVDVDDTVRVRIDDLVAALPHRPTFTVLVPITGAKASLVAATLRSLAAQRYAEWVLCLTGDGLPDPAVADVVSAVGDSRVVFTGPLPNPSGEWVVCLAPGDLLYEAALFAVADAVSGRSQAAVVYTDHDLSLIHI